MKSNLKIKSFFIFSTLFFLLSLHQSFKNATHWQNQKNRAVASLNENNSTLIQSENSKSMSSEVDLRVKYPEIFKQLPILNQGTFGTCYLQSAYTVLEFFRKREALKLNIRDRSKSSIAHLGLLTSTSSTSVSGGHPFAVVQAVNAHPWVCDEKAYPKNGDSTLFNYLDHVSITPFYVELFKRTFKDGKFNLKSLTKSEWSSLQELYENQRHSFLSNDFFLNQLVTTLSPEEFFQTISTAINEHSFTEGMLKNPMRKRIDSICSDSLKLKMPRFKFEIISVTKDKKVESLQRIWNYFNDQNAGPVSIGGCLSGLEHGECDKTKSDDHAMVILGRRMNYGGKEFLIRNSWGKTSAGLPDPNANGEAWVSDSLFYGFLKTVTFVNL